MTGNTPNAAFADTLDRLAWDRVTWLFQNQHLLGTDEFDAALARSAWAIAVAKYVREKENG